MSKPYDIFLSHASENKAEVVEPLVHALEDMGLRVWLDKEELHLGDNFAQKIREGLARCRFGVVILSPEFFKKSWPKNELKELLKMERNGQKVVLPIWHGLTGDEIASKSGELASRLGASWTEGCPSIVKRINRAVLDAYRSAAPVAAVESRAAKGIKAVLSGAFAFLGGAVIVFLCLLILGATGLVSFQIESYQDKFYGPAKLLIGVFLVTPFSGPLMRVVLQESEFAGGLMFIAAPLFGWLPFTATQYMFPDAAKINIQNGLGWFIFIFFFGLLTSLPPVWGLMAHEKVRG